MPRPGHCPACDSLFDTADRMPMVSVVCGHSLCMACTSVPVPDVASSDTESTASDEPDRQPHRCPVCTELLAGFVKNFEALAALQSSSPTSQPEPTTAADAPDLAAVVHHDLVIDRAAIRFRRSPANEVGKGTSAVVYRGSYDGKPVAVKCIRTMSDSFATEDRLRRELRNASRLKNPHIVEFRGAAWDFEDGPSSPRNVLLVTELMAGGNLRESLNTLAPESGISINSFLTIALQVARGIEYLHAEGLAHRDVKSANILLTERLPRNSNQFPFGVRAKIADFGLSKYIDKATGGGTVMQSIMEPGRLEATYAYLAPEAFGGDKSNVIRRDDSDDDGDARYQDMAKKRDIYALGVLFWEILTGQIPWSGISLPDVYVRVCVRSDRPFPALDDSIDKTFHRLIDRCWAQTPSRRPSARSIVAKLEKLAVKYHVEEKSSAAAAAAAVESVSVVSGPAPATPVKDGPLGATADGHHDGGKYDEIQREARSRAPSDALMPFHKMPSASTVHTAHIEDSKAHSNGYDASDTAADRTVDDIPTQYDESVWQDDGEATGKSLSHHASMTQANSSIAGVAPTASSEPADHRLGAPNRRSARALNGTSDYGENGHHAAAVDSHGHHPARGQHGAHVHLSSSTPQHHGSVTYGQSQQQPQQQTLPHSRSAANATAVAATAAAIAAAKDRERKREDARFGRGQSNRVARPVNGTGVGGESSFQSLPPSAENWMRTGTRDKNERAIFYDNSDEEAQDFDPERAAADEAMTESKSPVNMHQQPPRAVTPGARMPTLAQRSSSLGRVTGRPMSPVVRRPMSPDVRRPFTPVTSAGRVFTEEDSRVTHSMSRTSDVAIPPAPKRSASTSRGRLGRTLSASTPANNAARGAPPPTTSAPTHAATAQATAQATASAQDGVVKRAFIRRMRSNETARRVARSSSSTGVEKRAKNHQAPKSTPSHVSDTMGEGDDEAEYTVVQIGSGPKENFAGTVEALDKAGLMHLFSQRMQPLRLAALAHAALLSPKHRNDEEILRNCCAYLHRLTLPGSSSQGKSSSQQVSAKEQLGIRKYLKSRQGVEALLQALHPPEVRHPTTLSYGLLALGNITAWDLEAHKQFRSSHGVVQVTQVMKIHFANSGVQEKGCYALACVGAAYPAKSKNIFEQSGALDIVIHALSEVEGGEPNDAVTKQACAALGAMCSSSPANALHAGRKDALTYLVTSFERFRQASKGDGGGKRSEMRLVCKAFIDLLCHVENRKLAGTKGGSTMLIRAMRIFRLDAEFIETGLSTLSEFCALRSNSTQIVQANGVDDVVAAMERYRMSVLMQREGCRILTLLMRATGDQARRRMIQASGAEAVVFALERFGAIPDSHDEIVLESFRTLQMLFMMENPAESEVLGRRMRKIRCDKAIKAALLSHKVDGEIQEKGKEVLRFLGQLRGAGMGLWSRMRSGSKKL